LSALEVLCHYALYKSTFTLHYITRPLLDSCNLLHRIFFIPISINHLTSLLMPTASTSLINI